MFTLTIILLFGAYHIVTDPSVLMMNWQLPSQHSFVYALFFGFSAALLGVSGFESSANFIEEQEEGVFPKTLRNMWLAVAVFVVTFVVVYTVLINN